MHAHLNFSIKQKKQKNSLLQLLLTYPSNGGITSNLNKENGENSIGVTGMAPKNPKGNLETIGQNDGDDDRHDQMEWGC